MEVEKNIIRFGVSKAGTLKINKMVLFKSANSLLTFISATKLHRVY